MIDVGANDLTEKHLTSSFPYVRYQCEDREAAMEALHDYPLERIAIATTDYIGSDDRENERIAASFIKLQAITRQAAAFGFIPENVEHVVFFGGKGCMQDTEGIFKDLADRGVCVLYDNCYGFGARSLVKDEYLIRPVFAEYDRLVIGKGPTTDTLRALTSSRMITDVCKEFVQAVSPDGHSFEAEGVGIRHRSSVVEIATLGKRTCPEEFPQWQRREFEHAARDYDFLKNMVLASKDTEVAKISDEITDLTEIWKDKLKQRHIFISMDDDVDDYKSSIIETAYDLGIGNAVEAYYKGVPASDITA